MRPGPKRLIVLTGNKQSQKCLSSVAGPEQKRTNSNITQIQFDVLQVCHHFPAFNLEGKYTEKHKYNLMYCKFDIIFQLLNWQANTHRNTNTNTI